MNPILDLSQLFIIVVEDRKKLEVNAALLYASSSGEVGDQARLNG